MDVAATGSSITSAGPRPAASSPARLHIAALTKVATPLLGNAHTCTGAASRGCGHPGLEAQP